MDTNARTISTPSTMTGQKRKREGETKYYAVHRGRTSGVFSTYEKCFEQVKGFKGASLKSFTSRSDAEHFSKTGLSTANRSSKKPPKFYAVQHGHRPGVYTTWDEASAQISGWTKPKHRAFSTLAEAEAFVAQGSADTANGSAGSDDQVAKSGTAKKKRKSGNEAVDVAVDEDYEYEAGEGPLPTAGAEDNFDPGITLNPDTGELEYKTDEQLSATTLKAVGSRNDSVIRIYTDGSTLGNGTAGAVAGVGVYFGPSDKRNVSEPLTGPRQTNQRAELTAILRALEMAPRNRPLAIYSDSNYAINCVTVWFQKWRANGWVNASKKAVENKDLTERILGLLEERTAMRQGNEDDSDPNGDERVVDGSAKTGQRKTVNKVEFHWVKGHSSDAGNNAADGLATAGARDAKEILADA